MKKKEKINFNGFSSDPAHMKKHRAKKKTKKEKEKRCFQKWYEKSVLCNQNNNNDNYLSVWTLSVKHICCLCRGWVKERNGGGGKDRHSTPTITGLEAALIFIQYGLLGKFYHWAKFYMEMCTIMAVGYFGAPPLSPLCSRFSM